MAVTPQMVLCRLVGVRGELMDRVTSDVVEDEPRALTESVRRPRSGALWLQRAGDAQIGGCGCEKVKEDIARESEFFFSQL